jgi:hypothetical protein
LTSIDFFDPPFAWVGGSHSCAAPHCAVEAIESDFDCVKGIDLVPERYGVFEAGGCGYLFHPCNGGHEVEECRRGNEACGGVEVVAKENGTGNGDGGGWVVNERNES